MLVGVEMEERGRQDQADSGRGNIASRGGKGDGMQREGAEEGGAEGECR